MFGRSGTAAREAVVLDAQTVPDAVAAWAAQVDAWEGLHTPCGVLDPAELSAAGRVDALVALERLRHWVDYQQQKLLAVMAGDPADTAPSLGDKLATADVSCALRVPHTAAAARLHTASTVVHRLPATLELLRQGAISLQHVRVLVDAVTPLDDLLTRRLEQAVLERAPHQSVTAFRRSVQRVLQTLRPVEAEERNADALIQRRVCITPVEDGMSELWALLPADHATQAWDTLTTAAATAAAPDDDRTADQRRADRLVELILDHTSTGATGAAQRGASVQVTVALSTLTGADDQPGELAGYGPIPASMARRIAANPDSTWRRLVTDQTGQLLDYGRSTYRPPAGLDRFVRAHDATCVFPTCTRRARDCELDHLTAWTDDGHTTPANLAPECVRHHKIKHEAGWHVRRKPDGTIEWTSPTRHTYDRPPDPLPIDHTTNPDPPPF